MAAVQSRQNTATPEALHSETSDNGSNLSAAGIHKASLGNNVSTDSSPDDIVETAVDSDNDDPETPIEEMFVYSHHGIELLETLYNMAREGQHCDAALVSNDSIGAFIPVHKTIIVGVSPVLKKKFTTGVRSVVVDFPSDIIRKLIKFFYVGEININLDEFEKIEKAAFQLDVVSLKEICKMFREKHGSEILHRSPFVDRQQSEEVNRVIPASDSLVMDIDDSTGGHVIPVFSAGQKRSASNEESDIAKRLKSKKDLVVAAVNQDENVIYFSESTKVATEDLQNDDPLLFKCLYCKYYSKGPSSQNNLKKHMLHHLKPGKFKCPVCSFSTDTNASLSRHLAHHHTKEDWDSLPSNTDFTKMYPEAASTKPQTAWMTVQNYSGPSMRTMVCSNASDATSDDKSQEKYLLPPGKHRIMIDNEAYLIDIPDFNEEFQGENQRFSFLVPKGVNNDTEQEVVIISAKDHANDTSKGSGDGITMVTSLNNVEQGESVEKSVQEV
ncbi:unnamed protein product [Owenia fusiformis]|uniref:Uncharacterized protein n=1 Tax=Owenia fusiformis TaxID=6347 RepID=A0A8J1XFV7_OWEFU|nr:unnamed protein product [Owenia fusiformis]